MELFTRLFGGLLVFVYHCFDRIVINGEPVKYDVGSNNPDAHVGSEPRSHSPGRGEIHQVPECSAKPLAIATCNWFAGYGGEVSQDIVKVR